MRITDSLWPPFKELLHVMAEDHRLGADDRSLVSGVIDLSEARGHTLKGEENKVMYILRGIITKTSGGRG